MSNWAKLDIELDIRAQISGKFSNLLLFGWAPRSRVQISMVYYFTEMDKTS